MAPDCFGKSEEPVTIGIIQGALLCGARRDILKNASFIWVSSTRGVGWFQSNQKLMCTFCAPTILEFWLEQGGGGLDQNSWGRGGV